MRKKFPFVSKRLMSDVTPLPSSDGRFGTPFDNGINSIFVEMPRNCGGIKLDKPIWLGPSRRYRLDRLLLIRPIVR